MALSASIDDKTNIACFGLRALGLFARARADDPLLKHPLRKVEFHDVFVMEWVMELDILAVIHARAPYTGILEFVGHLPMDRSGQILHS